jgi:hypothetical protein
MARSWRECYIELHRVRRGRSQGLAEAQEDRAGQSVRQDDTRKGKTMGRIFKALFYLVIIGFIGLTAYAYLGKFAPVQSEVRQPVVLNAD